MAIISEKEYLSHLVNIFLHCHSSTGQYKSLIIILCDSHTFSFYKSIKFQILLIFQTLNFLIYF